MRWMRSRSLWEDGYILNIEELASLYHFPTIGVKAPATPYIDVKKGGPPVDLPMLWLGSEEEMKIYFMPGSENSVV